MEVPTHVHIDSTTQGNGINESSHRIFQHILRTDPNLASGKVTFKQAVRKAAYVYNSLPLSAARSPPIFLLTGVMPTIPGLSVIVQQLPEPARLSWMKYERQLERERLITLNNAHRAADFKKDDFVSYMLSDAERAKYIHRTGEQSWAAKWSLPCRVHKVLHDNEIASLHASGSDTKADASASPPFPNER